ncbi:iron ABC transporter permease [Candidatus Dependentiae bacterium]|nr:iron ABC transporter permease [Candidatus Dependentiae bacterium]
MKIKLFILILFTVLVILVSPYIGKIESESGIYKLYFGTGSNQNIIIRDIRIPQTLMAFFVGFALSVCGLVYQTLFHNDLASPFTLGVSSGAAFGAALAIKMQFVSYFYLPAAPLFAFIFGCITVLLLICLPLFRKSFDTFTLLLTGVALNFFYSSLILLISYLSNYSETFHIHRWLMGSIDELGYQNVIPVSVLCLIVWIIIYYFREDLNIILLSDETAQTRGINISKLKIILLAATSILLAFCVALCGPIGFIGIICPHISKIIFGHNHKIVLPVSALLGGLFLCLCFTISRLIIFPFIVPVGIITSFIGGPFLIFILFRSKSV